ncbi:MAG: cyclase family protein, partial [Saprospiraceae bacterium]|nr:cyclase family protein [Saprospiraceae bacterium]
NGTHTECVGHISKRAYTINQCLQKFHFFAYLVSLTPKEKKNGDRLICRQQLEEVLGKESPEALVVRTLPNHESKKRRNYSGSNPPYFHPEGIEFLVSKGIRHLLVDLPSIDREEDGGKLLGHRAFWNYPQAPRIDCTISELIFVPDEIPDGPYLLNLQIASFEIDVSPSKAVLFSLKKRN